MRKHYDLSGGGKPNPYVNRISAEGREVLIKQFLGEAHLVRLADDVAAVFPDEASVNQALRIVMEIQALVGGTAVRPPKRVRKAPPRARKRKAA
jgi:hypothetical protein